MTLDERLKEIEKRHERTVIIYNDTLPWIEPANDVPTLIAMLRLAVEQRNRAIKLTEYYSEHEGGKRVVEAYDAELAAIAQDTTTKEKV